MGRQIYVSTTGSDSAGGLALDAPVLTLAKALEMAQPGDVINLRGGEYQGGVTINTPNVTIQSYPGENAKLVCGIDSAAPDQVIRVNVDGDGAVIRDLEIQGGEYYGVKLESAWDWGPQHFKNTASNVTIENCVIHDTGRDCIKITPGCDNLKILNNEIYNSGMRDGRNAEGIDCVNGDNILVSGNHIHDTATTGAYFKGGSKNVVFENNLVERTGRTVDAGGYGAANSAEGVAFGYETDSEWFDPENTGFTQTFGGTIRNNIIRDIPGSGILVNGALEPDITNNTLYNVTYKPNYYNGGISITQAGTYTDGYQYAKTTDANISNNLVILAADSDPRPGYVGNYAVIAPRRNDNPSFAGETTMEGNIYFTLDGRTNALFGGGNTPVDFAGWKAELGFDQTSTLAGSNPVDPATLQPVPGVTAGATPMPVGADPDYAPPAPADDVTAPATVTNLQTTAHNEGYLLSWTPSADADVVFYEVYAGDRYLGWTTANGYYARPGGGTHDLTVVAVDRADNRSPRSESIEIVIDGAPTPTPAPNPGNGGGGTTPQPTPPEPDLGMDFGALPKPVNTITGVHPAPGSTGVDAEGQLGIKLVGPAYLHYTENAYLKIIRVSDGGLAGTVDFAPGHPDEGKGYVRVDLSQFNLEDGTEYMIVADRMFLRTNAEPWITEAIEQGQWNFTTGGTAPATPAPLPSADLPPPPPPALPEPDLDFGDLAKPVPTIKGVHPAPGSTGVDPDGQLALDLVGPAYFGYTDGLLRIVRLSDGAVVGVVDFEPGDPNTGKSVVRVDMGQFDLEPNTQYGVVADRMFLRANAAPWNAEAIAPGQWTFTTGLGTANKVSSGDDSLNLAAMKKAAIAAGAGNDDVLASAVVNTIDGGAGIDMVDYSASTKAVTVNLATGKNIGGFAQGDRLKNIEEIEGSRFNDKLTGNAAANRLDGGRGNDVLDGGRGNDILDGGIGADKLIGGAGADTADYSDAAAGVTLSLTARRGGAGEARGDTYNSVENVKGSAFQDKIIGDAGANSLDGGAGADSLYGAAGNDILIGGKGNDLLVGGAGNDRFVWYRGDGEDTIAQSGAGKADRDTIQLGSGIDRLDVDFVRIQGTSNLQIVVGGENGGSIIVTGFFTSANKVTLLSFADGTKLSAATIAAESVTGPKVVPTMPPVVPVDQPDPVTPDPVPDAPVSSPDTDDPVLVTPPSVPDQDPVPVDDQLIA